MPLRTDLGVPLWLRGKESACSAGDARDLGSIPGSLEEGTPVFWPGKSHGQRSWADSKSIGLQRVGHSWSDWVCLHKNWLSSFYKFLYVPDHNGYEIIGWTMSGDECNLLPTLWKSRKVKRRELAASPFMMGVGKLLALTSLLPVPLFFHFSKLIPQSELEQEGGHGREEAGWYWALGQLNV